MDMQEVYSSRVAEIGYDEESGVLAVKWQRSGKTSVYRGIPPKLAGEVMNAPSIGQALREHVEGRYEHGYL